MKLLHNVPGFRLGFAEILGQMGITLHLKSREKDGKMEERTDKRGTMGGKKEQKNHEDRSVGNAFKKTQTLAPLWFLLLGLPL